MSAPEYLSYIKITGLNEDTNEAVQGLGGGSLYAHLVEGPATLQGSLPAIPGEQVESLPQALWDTQSQSIINQNTLLQKTADGYSRKYNALPQYENLSDTLRNAFLNEFIEVGIGGIIKSLLGVFNWLPGIGDIPSEVAEFLAAIGIEVYEWVKLYYNSGTALCENMIDENTQALLLEVSWLNYDRRAEMIRQHEERISNLIGLITALEGQLQQGNFQGIVGALEDLSYQDTLVDLGGVKVHTKSKLIQAQ